MESNVLTVILIFVSGIVAVYLLHGKQIILYPDGMILFVLSASMFLGVGLMLFDLPLLIQIPIVLLAHVYVHQEIRRIVDKK